MYINTESIELKILTIEESTMISKRIQSILEEIDCVEFLGNATTIPQGLTMINKQKPHVVIFDIRINSDPKIGNGFDLLDLLRKKYPTMKLIVFTNLTQLYNRINCLALGANHFFDKSNDISKITTTLEEIHRKINEKHHIVLSSNALINIKE